jgi:hypothetical protein
MVTVLTCNRDDVGEFGNAGGAVVLESALHFLLELCFHLSDLCNAFMPRLNRKDQEAQARLNSPK